MKFLQEYFDVEAYGEHLVCCPFPHHSAYDDLEYIESNPSAHVNPEKGLFHCKACGRGFDEVGFVEELFGCSKSAAVSFLRCYESSMDSAEYKRNVAYDLCDQFNISHEVADELELSAINEDAIIFPAKAFNHVLDLRLYQPGKKPKVRSRLGSCTGLIIPYDIWKTSDKVTIVCAGEKDMAVARTHGLNAITITGGELATPKDLNAFKGRHVAICYDNDDTGRRGAALLAECLLKVTPHVKVVTGFHEICKEPKEDITDFFNKYNGTKAQLVQYIKTTEDFVPDHTTPEPQELNVPTVDLETALRAENESKLLQSNIQVVGTFSSAFSLPVEVKVGDAHWSYTGSNAKDMLQLIDSGEEDAKLEKRLRVLSGQDKDATIDIQKRKTVFKVTLTDMLETKAQATTPQEMDAYILDRKLESGKKYKVQYRIVPHPLKAGLKVMIIENAVNANDSVSAFELNEDAIANLQQVKELPGTVADKVNTLTEKVKGLLNYNGNNTLIQVIDLSFHTVLQFDLGRFKNIRGYLDTLVVGESRTGKSSTADTLRQHYLLGTFVSLAGNSATRAGLIGGSNKGTTGGFQTRAGVIPQNHRGLLIFEEFAKCKEDMITELTDIRSSNEVRIARVNGSITLPAMVRMITLTNPKNSDSTIEDGEGLGIIKDLVGAPEDIARYDLIALMPDRGNNQIDFMWEPESPLPDEVLQTRIRWIWSRKPDQIIFDDDTKKYLVEQANKLAAEHDTYIKVFGTETWMKLARLSIAVAGYCVSTDASFENIVVTSEHIDYAVSLFLKLYDEGPIHLKSLAAIENKRRILTEESYTIFKELCDKYHNLHMWLSSTNRRFDVPMMVNAGVDEDRKTITNIVGKLHAANLAEYDDGKYLLTPACKQACRRYVDKINVQRYK